MLKILYTMLYFARQLVYSSSDEHNFESRKFNTKKLLIFIIMLCLISFNLIMTFSISKLSNKIMNLELKVMKCVAGSQNNPIKTEPLSKNP